jgi:putative flavoprotein involved in K+ transport
MPEVHFSITWPDGTVQRAGSPSTAIERFLAPGATYPVAELRRRVRDGLNAASERVRMRFGMACTAAAAELDALEAGAAPFRDDAPATVGPLRRGVSSLASTAPVPRLSGHRSVVVVGGGQAGLAVSWHLTQRGIDHVVLERHRVAHSWREERWDRFCLVTPNWQCRLPGHPYAGDDPDGFMVRDQIVDYVASYAASFDAPVVEGVAVTGVEAIAPEGDGPCWDPAEAGTRGFRVTTSAGTLTADAVVLAVGGYHRPKLPRLAERLPAGVTQLHSSTYRSAEPLPDGGVLVVGSGQSGAQIAEDLHLAGRPVHLAVGSAPRVARFYRGRDVVAWLHDMGHYDMAIEDHPGGPAARHEANHYVTGRDGGRDIDLRRFATEGMTLHGRLTAIDGSRIATAGDLERNLDAADATDDRIKDGIDRWIAAQGIDAPVEDRYVPVWRPPHDGGGVLDLDAAGIRTVIWATGFRRDFSWVALPAFDGSGDPVHRRGVTAVPGLYAVGLPWLHTWGSGRFAGIARDAGHVVDHLAAQRDAAPVAPAARAA